MNQAIRKPRRLGLLFLLLLGILATVELDWLGANGDGGCGCDMGPKISALMQVGGVM